MKGNSEAFVYPFYSFIHPFIEYSPSVALCQVPGCSAWRPYLLGLSWPFPLTWRTQQLEKHRFYKKIAQALSEMFRDPEALLLKHLTFGDLIFFICKMEQ